jgi:hypothetical protein
MEDTQSNPSQKDDKLWKIAKKRAAFKKHLLSYIIINAFLWGLWLLSGNLDSDYHFHFAFRIGYYLPWPIYVSFFWGVGLVFDFFNSYFFHQDDLAEREYQKLKNKRSGN